MPTPLGAHNPRVELVRALLSKKGRKEHGLFTFEGATLLQEALDAGIRIENVYATGEAFERTPIVRDVERAGTAVYLVDDRTMRRISDVDTPAGVVAVAPMRFEPARVLFEEPGIVLVLAGVGDPGNAGTLLRSAEAFGARGTLFGAGSTEPYAPKVVRAAMGALFRARIARSSMEELDGLLEGWQVTGLKAGAAPLAGLSWGAREALVIGAERAGLGPWSSICTRFGAIPMTGAAESLNAASAGSIALYEAAGRRTT